MTIAITGATGQLGRHVLDHLLNRTSADNLVAVVRDTTKAAPIAAQGVEVREADYTDPAALNAAFAGVDTLLLISSNQVGERYNQHKNVIDAAVSNGVGHIAYTSVLHADSSPLVLAPEHKQTEEYLSGVDAKTTFLRNGWYTENYSSQIEAAKATGKLVAAAGDGKVASATRNEYAEAAAVVLTDESHAGKVFELSGDYAWDFNELAAAISEITGTSVSYEPVSRDQLVAALQENGLDEGTAGFVAQLDVDVSENLLSDTPGDLSKLIGKPTVGLVEGLSQSATAS